MDGGLVNSLGNVDYTTLPSVDGSALPNLPDHSFSHHAPPASGQKCGNAACTAEYGEHCRGCGAALGRRGHLLRRIRPGQAAVLGRVGFRMPHFWPLAGGA